MNKDRIASDGKSKLRPARSDHECFGCGDLNPIGLHLRFVDANEGVVARFMPAPEHQGYYGLVHGGIISTVLDEAMAWAAAQAGIWAVTGEMTVRFRTPLHVGELTEVVGRVTGNRGHLVMASAELRVAATATIVASATAKLVRVSEEKEAAWRTRYLESGLADA